MNENPKGAGFLKVVGILMIIFGGIGIVMGIMAVGAVGLLAAVSDGEIGSTLLTVSSILLLVSAVMELVAGILGVCFCKRPEKAGVCMAFGIIVALLTIAGAVLTVVGGDSFPVVSTLIGLVCPILFIIGAARNKK